MMLVNHLHNQSPSPRSPQPNISTLQLPKNHIPEVLDLFGCCCHFETKCFFIKGGSICCRHCDDVLLGGMGGGLKVWKSKPLLSFLISTILKNPTFDEKIRVSPEINCGCRQRQQVASSSKGAMSPKAMADTFLPWLQDFLNPLHQRSHL